MQYELSQEEIDHIEKYRDLTEEFQAALDAHMKTHFDLQTTVFVTVFNEARNTK